MLSLIIDVYSMYVVTLWVAFIFLKKISHYLPPLLDIVEQHLVRAIGPGNPQIISKLLLFKSYSLRNNSNIMRSR